MDGIAVEELSKPQLRASLLTALHEVHRLRDTVARLLRQSNTTNIIKYHFHTEDSVPAGWAERYGIEVPRADGIFESKEAWVRIKNGVIVGAGLKNQSILCLAISLGLLDQGAEYHGNLYKDWRVAFLARLDPSRSGDQGNDNPDAWSKEDRFSKLLHRVDDDNLEAMNCIVALRPKAKHLAAFQCNQAVFVSAFERVATIMIEINKEADDEIERMRRIRRQ